MSVDLKAIKERLAEFDTARREFGSASRRAAGKALVLRSVEQGGTIGSHREAQIESVAAEAAVDDATRRLEATRDDAYCLVSEVESLRAEVARVKRLTHPSIIAMFLREQLLAAGVNDRNGPICTAADAAAEVLANAITTGDARLTRHLSDEARAKLPTVESLRALLRGLGASVDTVADEPPDAATGPITIEFRSVRHMREWAKAWAGASALREEP